MTPELGEIRTRIEIGGKGSAKVIRAVCESCGKERWVQFNVGKNQPMARWCRQCFPKVRGRMSRTDGYIGIRLSPDDFFYPMANKIGYVPEHRLVMAQHLNRCLLPWEIIHHKNHIKGDNRLENLQLLPSQKEHLVDVISRRLIMSLKKQVDKQNQEIKLLKWHIQELNKREIKV